MAGRGNNRAEDSRFCEAVGRAIDATLRAGAIHYDRARHLPRLIRAVPVEFEASDAETARAIVARLESALGAERRRGRIRHWSYDINRHIALTQALRAERNTLTRALESRSCERP